MSELVPDVVHRYFAALNGRDREGLVRLFTPDAVVVDEGETYRGTSEIRSWVESVAFQFEYTAGLMDVEAAGDATGYTARARLEGNFPGGVVELNVRFDVEGEQVRRLENGA